MGTGAAGPRAGSTAAASGPCDPPWQGRPVAIRVRARSSRCSRATGRAFVHTARGARRGAPPWAVRGAVRGADRWQRPARPRGGPPRRARRRGRGSRDGRAAGGRTARLLADRVEEAHVSEEEEDRHRDDGGRHHPGGEDVEADVVAPAILVARERVGGRDPEQQVDRDRARDGHHGVAEVARHRPVRPDHVPRLEREGRPVDRLGHDDLGARAQPDAEEPQRRGEAEHGPGAEDGVSQPAAPRAGHQAALADRKKRFTRSCAAMIVTTSSTTEAAAA